MLFDTYVNNNLREDTKNLNKKIKEDLQLALKDYDVDIKNNEKDALYHIVFYLKDMLREYSPQVEEIYAIYKLKNNCSSIVYHVSSNDMDTSYKKFPAKLIN